MRALLALSVTAVAAAVGWLLWRREAAAAAPAAADTSGDWFAPQLYIETPGDAGVLTSSLFALEDFVTDWQKRGAPYRSVIEAAAVRRGVPPDLLMRVAYQESRFREDIITGKVKSRVGAAGMFQFMPATAAELGVDPLNVASAADGAARYLAQLRKRFGSWELALMAYNWGQGNVQKYLAGTKTPPTETRNYVAQIGADVSLA